MPAKNNSIVDLNDLKIVWRIFSKNWIILVVAVIISAVIANIYIHKQTSVFAAQTQLLLKSAEPYRTTSVIYESSFNYGSFEKTANEMRVIKSYNLIDRAISKLNLNVSYFIAGHLKTTEVYDAVPFLVLPGTINPNLYEQPIKVKILDEYRYSLSYDKGDETVTQEFYFNKQNITSDFIFEIRKNQNLNPTTIASLKEIKYQFVVHNKATLISKYQNSLTVENEDFTAILKIKVQDEIAERAVIFLDTLSVVYLENTLKSQIDINENTLLYIDRQLREVVGTLSSIEDTMENYKKEKSILDLTKEEEEYFTQLTNYESQRTSLKLQFGSIEALEKYIIEDKNPEFLPPSFYVNNNDDVLRKLVGELYNMQMARTNSLFMATNENMSLKEIEQKIVRLKKNILTYLTNTKIAITANIERVGKQINVYIASIKTIPEKQRVLLNIQRKMKVHENMYLFLLEKKANTVIARASIVPETKIIESARYLGKVYPDTSKLLYSFMGVGIVIALIIVFIRTAFFDRIESVEELKALTTIPVLGEILYSEIGKNSYIVVDADPKSPITESFRSIRTNLEYMGDAKESKIVLITSNNPGEGKTFCSINIASILAKAGKKVLIIELDLHKPKVHLGLGLSSEKGMSSILIGKDEISDCILHTGLENLDALLSGPTPPNASELILSKHMEEVLIYGREHYDYVIIDTPPVGLISDALVLIKFTDVNLFVLNTKFATKESVNNAIEIVDNNTISNFGFILNGVMRKRSRYYYNRYGYGYGGYGYGGYTGYGYGNQKDSKS